MIWSVMSEIRSQFANLPQRSDPRRRLCAYPWLRNKMGFQLWKTRKVACNVQKFQFLKIANVDENEQMEIFAVEQFRNVKFFLDAAARVLGFASWIPELFVRITVKLKLDLSRKFFGINFARQHKATSSFIMKKKNFTFIIRRATRYRTRWQHDP